MIGTPMRGGQRAARAGLAGAGLAVLWAVLVLFVPLVAPCGPGELGCLGAAVLVWAGAAGVGVLAGGAVLRLAGVRPAWPVAVLGPAVAGALIWLLIELQVVFLGNIAMLGVLVVAGYAVGGLVTTPGVGWPWRAGLVVAVAGLWLLAPRVGDWREDRVLAGTYPRAGVPLLGPDLPGYLVTQTHANEGDHQFSYELLAEGAVGQTVVTSQIRVVVSRLPAWFQPPARCSPATDPAVDVTCQAVDTGTWRRREDVSLTYLVRRDGVLVHLVGGSEVPEATLRPPAHFLPLER